MDLKLVEPCLELKNEFLAMAKEVIAEAAQRGLDQFVDSGLVRRAERFSKAINNFEKYIAELQDFAAGKNLPEGYCASTTCWLVTESKRVAGTVRIRHELMDMCKIEGGHIGYDIRPTERNKGYGMAIFRLALDKAKDVGIARALVTCDDDNVASAKIIEKNGGIFENAVEIEDEGKTIKRYWIDLKGAEDNG